MSQNIPDELLIARRKEGLNVIYRLDDPVIERICHVVCETILKELPGARMI